MLKIDTKKSLYKPIEIEIDGRVYKLERIDPEVIKKFGKIQKEIMIGNFENVTAQMNVLFPDMPKKTISKLDIRDINEITYYIAEMITSPEKKEGEEEKKS